MLKKLLHKPEYSCLILNCPQELMNMLPETYDKDKVAESYDFTMFFSKNQTELRELIPTKLPVAEQGLVWLAYPKKSSSIKSDLSRDSLWDVLKPQGYRPVSMVSLDETWSAMRFKLEEQVKSKAQPKQTFEAVIETSDTSGGAWVTVPFDVKDVFGTKGQVKVKASLDGHSYEGSIANMGTGGHILIVKKEIRKAINKDIGDTITVKLAKDTSERTVEIPVELEKVLDENKDASQFYNSLSYTNRKEYAQWIATAKRAETKEKRLAETLRRLNEGIKNPFAK
ncbi:MAG: YdeI/OmpD-associated family protein [Bacteroidota bacterium]